MEAFQQTAGPGSACLLRFWARVAWMDGWMEGRLDAVVGDLGGARREVEVFCLFASVGDER